VKSDAAIADRVHTDPDPTILSGDFHQQNFIKVWLPKWLRVLIRLGVPDGVVDSAAWTEVGNQIVFSNNQFLFNAHRSDVFRSAGMGDFSESNTHQ